MSYTPKNPNGQAIKANSQPVTIASDQEALPLSVGAATSAKQDTGNTSIASIDTKVPSLGQALSAASVPVVLPAAQLTTLTPPAAITGFATETTSATRLSESDFDTKTGSLTETAPASDTASSGLNGRLQRIAQRLASIFTAQSDGSQQSKITDGTNVANVLKADGTAAAQNAMLMASSYREVAGLSAGALSADLVPSTDIGNMPYVSLQILGTWVGTLTIAGSNDNITFSTQQLPDANYNGNFSTTTSNRTLAGYFPFRYIRVRMTSYTSGTATAVLELRQQAPPNPTQFSQQSGTWTAQAGTSATSALTSVAAATSSTQLLASNTSRKAAHFFNDSTAVLYLAFATSASTTAYTVQIAAGGFFEMPVPVYTGAIFGIWAATNGSVRITEGS